MVISDKYDLLRSSVQALAVEAQSNGAVIAPGTLKSQLGEQQPATYASPQALENFKATGRTGGTGSREWMSAMPAPGLVAVYREPFAEDCLAGETKGPAK